MNTKWVFKSGLILILFLLSGLSQEKVYSQEKYLIVRLDDLGMCHAANMGGEMLFATGLHFSTSVMWACPWQKEAIEILKKYPDISVGAHLTLNSEWKNYKWGPVQGKEKVPSLVTDKGYFRSQGAWFWRDSVDLDEMDMEFRAQIDRALASGLKISYMDNHMGAGRQTPEQISIIEKIAGDYQLGISGYFEENKVSIEGNTSEEVTKDLLEKIEQLKPGVNLIVIHPGMQTPEMDALSLSDNDYYGNISVRRDAVVKAFSSDEFRKALIDNNIKLIGYRELIEMKGLSSMIYKEE
jgi:predicted glycoside hydrolase/deacetylase ChbG (UPF0249 family)